MGLFWRLKLIKKIAKFNMFVHVEKFHWENLRAFLQWFYVKYLGYILCSYFLNLVSQCPRDSRLTIVYSRRLSVLFIDHFHQIIKLSVDQAGGEALGQRDAAGSQPGCRQDQTPSTMPLYISVTVAEIIFQSCL